MLTFAPPEEPVDEREKDERQPAPHHDLEGEVHKHQRRPVLLRHGVETLDYGAWVVGSEEAQPARYLDGAADGFSLDVRYASDEQRRVGLRLEERLHGCKLGGLSGAYQTGRGVSADGLSYSGYCTDDHCHGERGLVIEVAPAL